MKHVVLGVDVVGDIARVLVVDDDADQTEYLRLRLQRDLSTTVSVAGDAPTALSRLVEDTFDLVITDIEMPGMSGLAMLSEVRRIAPRMPIIVITAHATIDYAVDALRRDADEFLVKPVDATTLLERIHELIATARARATGRRDVVLAIGAHPDDVEIGVGATLAHHHEIGDSITILTLSAGAAGGSVPERERESRAAAEIVGARLELRDFEDTRLDPAGGVTSAVEEVVRALRPNVVYTHSAHDRHQDHRAVQRAVEIASRKVPEVASFQSPSCTIDFRPTRFIPVDGMIETKLAMLAAYESQQHRDYMQPEIVRATARYWSRFGDGRYCEPVEILRAAASLARVGTTSHRGTTAPNKPAPGRHPLEEDQ